MKLNFEWQGKSYMGWTASSARDAGIPEEVVADALMQARRILVGGECRRRIYAVASAESQMNMAAAVGVISGKTASARSEDEKGILAGAEAAIGWVASMRAAVGALAADADADFTADAAWPDVPTEALSMIQNF